MRHFIFTVFCLFLTNCGQSIAAQTTQAQGQYSIFVESEDYRQRLLELMPDAFKVGSIQYIVHGLYDPVDCQMLTGWHEHATCTNKELLNGLFYLKQAGFFEQIELQLYALGDNEYDIELILQQSVLLERLKVSGFLRNKQPLKSLYVIDPGDVFTHQKHDYSLEQMKLLLKDQGFLSAQIHDLILPENSQKAVVVRCGIVAGSKFVIDSVCSRVNCVGNIDNVDLEQLSQYLNDFFIRKLRNKYYHKALLDSARSKVRMMLRQQGFVDVEIHEDVSVDYAQHKVNLKLLVTLEKKREFVFWGNSFFKGDQILEALLLYGKSTWHFPGSIIKDEIIQLYKNKGFWNVSVSVKEERQRIFCFIQEGNRAVISDVVVDNVVYPYVHMFIQRHFKSSLRSRFYDKENIKKCLDAFLKAYKTAGFWDVKVVKEAFIPHPKKQHTYIYKVTVDEGVRRIMGSISVQGFANIQSLFLQTWGNCRGKGFDGQLLLEQKQWLLRYFKNQGYQNISIEHELHDQNHVIDVVWIIKLPESVMKFGKTIILGSTKVAYHKLQKEIAYQEGENWNKALLENTLQNLKEIPVFESIQIYPGKDIDEFGYKPLFIKLVEAEKYEIKSRFGLQQVGKNLQPRRGFTYKVGASIGVNQIFSSVDKGSVFVDMTRFYRDLGVTYDIPWVFDKRVRCQLKLYNALYQQPVYIGSKDSLYQAGQEGLLWNMSRKFDRLTVSGSVGVEFLSLYEADQPDLNVIIRYDKNLLGKKIGYMFAEPTMIFRHVDNELNPTRGYVSFLSCRGMFDFQNRISFCKALIEHTQYLKLIDDMVIAIRIRLGHVFNRCFDQIHPIERFYLGGASSVRGYERDYCPPFGRLTKPIYDPHAGLPPQADNIWRYAPQGGRTMFNVNAELRCGVYKNFGVVAFSDFGALFQNSLQETMHTWLCNTFTGSGLGIRYDTPIGPFRFDVGMKWKIQYKDFEAPYVVYLSLGQAF